MERCWGALLVFLGVVGATCPGEGFPPAPPGYSGPLALVGHWVDTYSSRYIDEALFPCMGQNVTEVNASAVLTTTTAKVVSPVIPYTYLAEFLNVVHEDARNVFDLVPANHAARFFNGSLFFIVDFDEASNWYAWQICDPRPEGSDDYEFHVMARDPSSVDDAVSDRVLAALAKRGLNPQNATMHRERHPSHCAPSSGL